MVGEGPAMQPTTREGLRLRLCCIGVLVISRGALLHIRGRRVFSYACSPKARIVRPGVVGALLPHVWF